jgi:integrase
MTPAGLRSFTSALRPFLKFTGQIALVMAVEGLRFERPRIILDVLTEAETTAIMDVLSSGAISARDRGIVLLAMTTGLRACDIVGLQLADLDWRGDRICLVQKKTGNPLVLPLLPVVGNAISEYLLDGRPATTDRHVFLRQVAPHVGLTDHGAVYAVMKRVFALAGIGPGRCGARLARHSVASKMLTAGTPSPTISAVLGHVDPSSADRYLSTDADGLRSCVLPLPKTVLR